MKASAEQILVIFEKKIRLEVPLFQRQYVWSKEKQWEPLWEDISRKFTEYLEGRLDAPVHFLGAMVLDQKQTPTTHVERRQIIDGQQRLTTFQIFLSVFRDYCAAKEVHDYALECQNFIKNSGMLPNPEVDVYKVWPTQSDVKQFRDIVDSGSLEEIYKRYPLKYKKYARNPEARPRMIDAYLFFYEKLDEFFKGLEEQSTNELPQTLSKQLDACFQAIKNALYVVVIDLDDKDDAQVIFETLNARGEPLLPADLLRNYIFLRAARRNEPQESLYKEYWSEFDDKFWRVEVKQGRMFRPRSDLFMQYYLSSREGIDIPVKHLFVEYKHWITKSNPFTSVAEELESISRQGRDFKRLIQPDSDDIMAPLSRFLDVFEVRTCLPLLLAFMDHNTDDHELTKVSNLLESYLLRRAVCNLSTKNYNKIFLGLVRNLKRDGFTSEALSRHLNSLSGDTVEWPSDQRFSSSWKSADAYNLLSSSKMVHILSRLSQSYLSAKNEEFRFDRLPTIEHIMPQNWYENWPLQDGSRGLGYIEMQSMSEDNPKVISTKKRLGLIHTIGNLTILTQPLNSAVSNSPWSNKKSEMMTHSLLPINQVLSKYDQWDEDTVESRSEELLIRALTIWAKPKA